LLTDLGPCLGRVPPGRSWFAYKPSRQRGLNKGQLPALCFLPREVTGQTNIPHMGIQCFLPRDVTGQTNIPHMGIHCSYFYFYILKQAQSLPSQRVHVVQKFSAVRWFTQFQIQTSKKQCCFLHVLFILPSHCQTLLDGRRSERTKGKKPATSFSS
jgi:hypothetical protein